MTCLSTPKLLLSLGMVLFAAALSAPADEAPAVYPLAAPSLSLDQLASMSWCELEQLYREAPVGTIPCGFVEGRAIYCPCKKGSAARSKMTRLAWRGKVFEGCTMVNQWRGIRAIHAKVYEGPSWLDGKPSIILDYQGSSKVWADVRDEIREVCPGVYLGVMYLRRCPEPEFKTYFALQVPCCKGR